MKCVHKIRFSTRIERSAQIVLLLAGALLFTGCALGPKYNTPGGSAPPAYKEIGNWKTAQPNDQNLGGNWWEIFHDLQLNALEEQINVSNQNLKAAVAQYQESRAAVRYVRADYYPTVSTSPSATRERYSNNRPPHSSGFDGLTFNDFVLPVNISYQANIWGRVSRDVEAHTGEQAQASAADLAVVNLSMHATLAVDYFAARTLDAEEKLLKDTVAQYEQALQLNDDRYHGGLGSEVKSSKRERYLRQPCPVSRCGVARAQYEHAAAVLSARLRRISHCRRCPSPPHHRQFRWNTFGITRAPP